MTSFQDDNGNYLDYSGEDFSVQRQVASFRSFSIKGDVSISFSIPNNSINRKSLGYFGLAQVNSPAFSRGKYSLIKNGNSLMRGYIVIESDAGDTITCYFISGNANWFGFLDFKCNEIRNDALSVQWNAGQISNLKGATSGIVFPLIDNFFYRNKFDKYYNTVLYKDLEGVIGTGYPDFLPCLYVNTLVNEIAKKSKIKISGSLLSDKLFNSLIITPESPDLVDPATGLAIDNSLATSGSSGALITIGSIAPTMKAIDLIKWLCFSFGCVPTFDEYSQTLSLDKVKDFMRENAEDWSQYYVSSNIEYTKVFQNNYLKTASAQETEISDMYDPINTLGYGEINIQSPKTDGSGNDIYTSPFAPVKDAVGTSPMIYAGPFVQLLKLTDSDPIAFTSVTNNGGKAQFNGAELTNWQTDNGGVKSSGMPWRVKCTGSTVYDGYHSAGNNLPFLSNADFISNQSGFIYPQKVESQKAGPRILICVPNMNVSDFTTQPSINVPSVGNLSQVAYAYWSKPTYSAYPKLNSIRPGLNYGPINLTGYQDISLTDEYYDVIKRYIKAPPIQTFFVMPEKTFKDFDFKKFVRLQTKELNGYFMCEIIDGYKDTFTPVRCDLIPVWQTN